MEFEGLLVSGLVRAVRALELRLLPALVAFVTGEVTLPLVALTASTAPVALL
jgi:hypothetical protein